MARYQPRIDHLKRQRAVIIGLAADDILAVISLADEPAKLARYDFLMAQPRRDLQQSLKEIDAELALLEGENDA